MWTFVQCMIKLGQRGIRTNQIEGECFRWDRLAQTQGIQTLQENRTDVREHGSLWSTGCTISGSDPLPPSAKTIKRLRAAQWHQWSTAPSNHGWFQSCKFPQMTGKPARVAADVRVLAAALRSLLCTFYFSRLCWMLIMLILLRCIHVNRQHDRAGESTHSNPGICESSVWIVQLWCQKLSVLCTDCGAPKGTGAIIPLLPVPLPCHQS